MSESFYTSDHIDEIDAIGTTELAVPRLDHDGRMERLNAIVVTLREGKHAEPMTVRELLGWFDNSSRRGVRVVRRVRYALRQAGLVTYPDFEATWIDGLIAFKLTRPLPVAPTTQTAPGGATPDTAPCEPAIVEPADPINRIKQLPAANNRPLRVRPDEPLLTAVTLMLAHDYSQLPVMTTDREVKGVVTWRSIASRWALGCVEEAVRAYLEPAPEIASSRPMLEALPAIIDCGFILVRDETKAVVGIVSASDLGDMFQQLAEPFLLLGEIERHIRVIIETKLTRDDLASVREPWDDRIIESVADLTFGQYVRLLEDPRNWARVAPRIDRGTFTGQLAQVREIRNDVMHFNPDPLDAKQLGVLRRFSRFLQTLRDLGL